MVKNGLPAPYVMLLLAPLLWATSNVTGKLGKGWLTPYEMTFFRWFIATLILTFFARKLIEKDWAVIKQHWLWLFIVGGGGFALFNIVLYSAFSMGASVVNVSIITALIPFGVICFSAFIYKDNPHLLQWLGIGIAFIGVIWILTGGQPFILSQYNFALGDSLALVTTGIYIAYSIALRHAPKIHWASLMWAMSLAGLVVATPFYGYDLAQNGIHFPDWRGWLMLLYIAIFISIISKLFYMESVIQIGANRASLAMNLLPVFGAVMGVMFFKDEMMTMNHIIALALVMIGIISSEYGAALKRQPHMQLASTKN
ncbi:DMT family transporter [Psychrobacter sp. DM8]|uniref:DMT family transporter n=1 Tax=unclassified Psychrobacter TaxID=196806 RepID=UPI003F4F9AC7